MLYKGSSSSILHTILYIFTLLTIWLKFLYIDLLGLSILKCYFRTRTFSEDTINPIKIYIWKIH